LIAPARAAHVTDKEAAASRATHRVGRPTIRSLAGSKATSSLTPPRIHRQAIEALLQSWTRTKCKEISDRERAKTVGTNSHGNATISGMADHRSANSHDLQRPFTLVEVVNGRQCSLGSRVNGATTKKAPPIFGRALIRSRQAGLQSLRRYVDTAATSRRRHLEAKTPEAIAIPASTPLEGAGVVTEASGPRYCLRHTP
jgi:hypothetical protein